MNAVAYLFKCADCGDEFKAPEVPEFSYGLFVLRSDKSDKAVFLDAPNDPVFLESYQMVKENPLLQGATPERKGEIQQSIFGSTCDSPAGEVYRIGLSPRCPKCGSRNMRSKQQIFPVEATPIPLVEHTIWYGKSYREKFAMVHREIEKVLSGSTST